MRLAIVTPFQLWNDVSVFCNSEVISRPYTSGFAAMLTLTVHNMSPIVTLGQTLLSWVTS